MNNYLAYMNMWIKPIICREEQPYLSTGNMHLIMFFYQGKLEGYVEFNVCLEQRSGLVSRSGTYPYVWSGNMASQLWSATEGMCLQLSYLQRHNLNGNFRAHCFHDGYYMYPLPFACIPVLRQRKLESRSTGLELSAL